MSFIHELAQYEKALDRVSATEDSLRVTLFGPRPYAEAIIVRANGEAVAFALYYFSYIGFSALPGLYLEDIFVRPAVREAGIGATVNCVSGTKSYRAELRSNGMVSAELE